MRNPVYDLIGVGIAIVIALAVTLIARYITEKRMSEEGTSITLSVTDSSMIEPGKEISIGGKRLVVLKKEGHTLTVAELPKSYL